MSSLVSVGLPVYNGERFLEETIECILGQTHRELELIISDNASTDATPEICRRFAELDDRVRYVRAETNQGLAWNFGRVVELATGPYFKWATHDDLFSGDFIERAVEGLEANPRCVLSFSDAQLIDADGAVIEKVTDLAPMDVDDPILRLRTLLLRAPVRWMWQLGVIRTEVLRSFPPYGGYAVSDSIVVERLALRGPFHRIPEVLFSFRLHETQSEAVFRDENKKMDHRTHAAFVNPELRGRMVFPMWRLLREHFSSLVHAPLSLSQRFTAGLWVLRWVVRKRRPLTEDVIAGIRAIPARLRTSRA